MKLFRHPQSFSGKLARAAVAVGVHAVSDKDLFGTKFGAVSSLLVNRRVRREKVRVGTLSCGWYIPPCAPPDRAVLYIHGGAYIGGSDTLEYTASNLAASIGMRVLAVDYRLAPDYPFPAAQHDCLTAYYWLRSQGASEDKIAVLGDSAGGGLAVSLTMLLRDNGEVLPSSLILVSPWVDLTCRGKSYGFAHDPVLRRRLLTRAAESYSHGVSLRNPYVSPTFGNLRGLPPTMILSGTDEVLLSDSVELSRSMRKSGVLGEIHIFKGMFHDFPLTACWLHESRIAYKHIARFIDEQMIVTA